MNFIDDVSGQASANSLTTAKMRSRKIIREKVRNILGTYWGHGAKKWLAGLQAIDSIGVPTGIRTPVTAVKEQYAGLSWTAMDMHNLLISLVYNDFHPSMSTRIQDENLVTI